MSKPGALFLGHLVTHDMHSPQYHMVSLFSSSSIFSAVLRKAGKPAAISKTETATKVNGRLSLRNAFKTAIVTLYNPAPFVPEFIGTF